jgi:hypothetical protein
MDAPGGSTMSRRSHQECVGENDRGLKPTAGKKGGEVASTGHGPATQQRQDREGGQEKPKKKTD